MPATSEITVRITPNTDALRRVLEIIARHAQACADELGAAVGSVELDYDAGQVAEAAHRQAEEDLTDAR